MFYEIAIRAVNLLWHFWFRLEINGRENEPQSGGYILASNHCSAIDPMIVCQGIRKHHIHFMAKAELFEIPVLKHVIRWLKAFPVSRGTGDTTAIETAMQVIRDGEVLGLFPEGTRSKDGNLLRFKSGLALIAQQTGAPVLPVTITYCDPDKRFRSRVVVNYGTLISCEELGIHTTGAAAAGDLSHARELKDATRNLKVVFRRVCFLCTGLSAGPHPLRRHRSTVFSVGSHPVGQHLFL